MKKRLVNKKVAFCRARTGEIEGLRHAYTQVQAMSTCLQMLPIWPSKKLNSYPSFEGCSQGWGGHPEAVWSSWWGHCHKFSRKCTLKWWKITVSPHMYYKWNNVLLMSILRSRLKTLDSEPADCAWAAVLGAEDCCIRLGAGPLVGFQATLSGAI